MSPSVYEEEATGGAPPAEEAPSPSSAPAALGAAPPAEDATQEVTITIRAGHGGNQTVTLENTCIGKAQIVEVTPKQCEASGKTPYQVAALVKRAMKPYAKTLKPPVRKAEWLVEAREHARNEKRKALGV